MRRRRPGPQPRPSESPPDRTPHEAEPALCGVTAVRSPGRSRRREFRTQRAGGGAQWRARERNQRTRRGAGRGRCLRPSPTQGRCPGPREVQEGTGRPSVRGGGRGSADSRGQGPRPVAGAEVPPAGLCAADRVPGQPSAGTPGAGEGQVSSESPVPGKGSRDATTGGQKVGESGMNDTGPAGPWGRGKSSCGNQGPCLC